MKLVVVASSANDSRLPAAGPVGLGTQAPNQTSSRPAGIVDDGCVQGLLQCYEQQGFVKSYIDRLMAPWRATGAKLTMSRHRNIWDHHWVVWCRERDFDPFEYSVVRLANYLTELQDSQEDNQGSSKNHASFKSHRAGIVAIFSLAHPTKPNLAESPAIKGLAERLRVSAPNGAKYTETISLTPVFMRYIADCKNGMTFWLMSLYELRSRMAMLGRIKTMGRSGDIGVINRMFAGDTDDYAAGCQGDKQNNQILNVRYDFPKTWRSLSRMSEWKKLGEYLHLCPGFLPEYALCCVRSAFEIYYQRTKNLPIV